MTSDRLPKQSGEWIDRSRTVRFKFEGREYTGYAGDTISSALWAAGVRMLGRSFKYHRPRGVLSFANHDVNDVVESPGHTNIRADIIPVRDGDEFIAVNTVGGLEKDKARFFGLFSAMMPVGFYYKAFHTPRKLFPFYERKMREMAGLGAVNPKSPRVRTPKAYDWCDVCIVGAGPTGLSAAIAAGEQGARVLVIDENPKAGGSIGYLYASDASAQSQLKELLAKIETMPNVRVKLATEVAGYYADHWIALIDETRLTKLRARSVIIASGAMEQPAVFHNNDLPGVMLGSAAQRLIHRYAVKPFQRGVVLAANSDAYRAALDLHSAGVEIAAIVDLRAKADSSDAAKTLAAAKIPVYQNHTVYSATPAKGNVGIVGASIAPLDSHGNAIADKAFEIRCDGIAMSVGYAACDSLLNQAGAKMTYSDAVHQFVPKTLPKGVFAAGRVNGLHRLEDQIADGRRAALAATSLLGQFSGAVPEVIVHQGDAPSHPYPIFPHPKGKDFIDFDEDVQYKDVKNAVQEGFDSIELIKRYTTLGMGPSQGKVASMNGVRTLAHIRNRTINETGTTTSRPFWHPVPFSHLAGRSFHPHRHTAMHSRHVRADAVFMPAGAWLRPAYYAKNNRNREDAIQAEVKLVRERVGMIDVGTLGKIEVCGPDAAEFLERTYTGKFANMKVGTTRYLVMCDESGVVVDDGVAARLAPDRFYVTATTTGVEGVYREMQRNVQLWRMNVTLVHLTGTFAAMNLAGPTSRSILRTLTDINLDATAFPYLGIREGVVAGVPARVMRVGFVGEWGYEIHVPTQFGCQVWDRIMQAGAGEGIEPFGVEAQRVLRLEKGHIIIGADTDGLTNPFESGLTWAVKLEKSFFVGQRSLQIVQKKPITRTLVGFMLPQGFTGPAPKECHLVIKNGTITGRVTSVSFSPSLKRVLGLAYVAPDQSNLGTKFTIRVDGAKEVVAEVVKTPFYDPENRKQSESIEKPKEAAA